MRDRGSLSGKFFRTGIILFSALAAACIKQPEDVSRSNPFDVEGSNWRPPIVTAMADTAVKPNDSITITATAIDNGTITAYAWAKDGTTYSDTTVVGSLTVAWPDSGRRVVRVKVIDDLGLVSAPDACIVTVSFDPPVANAGPDTTVSIYDTVRLHGSATDRLGFITSLAWDIGNTGTFVTTTGDTAFVAPASENLNYLCVLRVIDDDGNTARDTVRIMVRLDVPAADAGIDTIAGTNDTILLHGSAFQQFGYIVAWEWKIGPGSWTATSGPDTTVIMPDSEQTCLCSLAVTDDDGNRSVDGKRILVWDNRVGKFGNYTEFADLSSHAADFLLGSRITVTVNATLTHLCLIVKTAGAQVKMGLYRNAGGEPGTLVASTPATLLAVGVMEIAVTPTTLPAGDYWIMGVYDTLAHIGYSSSNASAVTKYIYHNFNTALPTTFPAVITYTGQEFNYYIKAAFQ